jgi:hypothetical protein
MRYKNIALLYKGNAMADVIQWSYEYLYKWYGKHDDNQVDNLLCIIYRAQRPKKKDRSQLECFVRHNISYIGKCPVQPSAFANGLYTILDQGSQRKWMFFVFPTEKAGIMFADHFSFCHDTSDKRTPIHFHKTTYRKEDDADRYLDLKDNDYMPDNIEMPRNGDMHGIFGKSTSSDKTILLDLIRRPWYRKPGSASISAGSKSQINRIANKPIISFTFNAMWEHAEFKDMVAFGFRDGVSVTWNVSFNRKGRRPRGRLQDAYVFTTPDDDEKTFQNMLASIRGIIRD